jgi:hypothetical protein
VGRRCCRALARVSNKTEAAAATQENEPLASRAAGIICEDGSVQAWLLGGCAWLSCKPHCRTCVIRATLLHTCVWQLPEYGFTAAVAAAAGWVTTGQSSKSHQQHQSLPRPEQQQQQAPAHWGVRGLVVAKRRRPRRSLHHAQPSRPGPT